jgi:MoaA/NifB/PqqE/SkfB family radical SAM enzyme
VSLEDSLSAYVDTHGRIVLPAETRARLGLLPGAEVRLVDTLNGVTLRRSPTQLAKVYIEPTSRCNLACPMCIRESWDEKQGNMTDATFSRLLDGLKSLEQRPVIVFGGFGEPLFHPRILHMIARAQEVGERVELITNGLLLSEQTARELIRLKLDRVWFSVDRLHANAPGNGAALPANIDGLNKLRMSLHTDRPETGFVFVATRSNLDELPDLLRRGIRYGVSHYMVTNVLPYTREMCEEMLYQRSLDQIESRASYWSPAVELPRMDLDAATIPPLHQAMKTRANVRLNNASLNPSQGHCPFIEAGALAASWDGAISPCLALMHSHVSYLLDKPRNIRRYAIGNVNDLSLNEIWNDAEHLAFRRRVQEFDFSPCTLCGSCDMIDTNQEDCFGNTFPTCGGCLWAWGVIQCP